MMKRATCTGEAVDIRELTDEEKSEREAWQDSMPLDELRARKRHDIENYALSLMQSRIPALDSFAMVAFLKTIWPTLTDPDDQPDLAYCRDVYLHAMDRLDQLATADRDTIEGYDPAEDTGWP